MLADYVLPAASKLERPVLSTTEDFASFFVAGERAIPPLGERKQTTISSGSWPCGWASANISPGRPRRNCTTTGWQPLGITFEQAAREKY